MGSTSDNTSDAAGGLPLRLCSPACRLSADLFLSAFIQALRSIRRPSVCTPFPQSLYPKDPVTLDNDYSSALRDSLTLLLLLHPGTSHGAPPAYHSTAPGSPLSSTQQLSSHSPDQRRTREASAVCHGRMPGTPEGGTVPQTSPPIPPLPLSSRTPSPFPSSPFPSSPFPQDLLQWLLSSRRTAGALPGPQCWAPLCARLPPDSAAFFQDKRNQPSLCFATWSPECGAEESFWESSEGRGTPKASSRHTDGRTPQEWASTGAQVSTSPLHDRQGGDRRGGVQPEEGNQAGSDSHKAAGPSTGITETGHHQRCPTTTLLPPQTGSEDTATIDTTVDQVNQVNDQVNQVNDHINDQVNDHINDQVNDPINDRVNDRVNEDNDQDPRGEVGQVDPPEGSGDADGVPRGSGAEPGHRCSFLAFHGTSSENLHSILRCGLLSLTGTDLQKNGSLHGQGIYLSTSPQVAMSFAKPGDTLAPLPDSLPRSVSLSKALRSAAEGGWGSPLPVHRQSTVGTPQQTAGHTTGLGNGSLGGSCTGGRGIRGNQGAPGAPGVSAVRWCEDVLAQRSVLGAQPVFLLACQVFVGPGVRRGPEAEEQAPACVVCGRRLRVHPRCTEGGSSTEPDGPWGATATPSAGGFASQDGQGSDGAAPKQGKGGLGTYVVVDSPDRVIVRYVMAYQCAPTAAHAMVGEEAAAGVTGEQLAALEGRVHGQGHGAGGAGIPPLVRPRLPAAAAAAATRAGPVRRGSDTCSMLLWAYAALLLAVGLTHSPWVATWRDWLHGMWYPRDVELDFM